MPRAKLDVVSFPTLQSSNELCNALAGLSYDVRRLNGPQWLSAHELLDAKPCLLYLGSGTYPRDRICTRLRRAPAPLPLAVAHSNQWTWDYELLSTCSDVLLWPCVAGELEYRVGRITGTSVEPPATESDPAGLGTDLGSNLVGKAPVFLDSLALMRKIAACQAPVLICGETGTGKELAARAIHYLGERSDQPFVPFNCGAVPDELFENELFGHERGAYTDAKEDRAGVIGRAEGGSLFLDEIDTLSPKAQVALLRFFQDQQYTPLGGRSVRRGDVRIIAATNADIAALVTAGAFRQDLFFRINILVLPLPPLRQRTGDISVLADHYIRKYCNIYGRGPRRLHDDALSCMEAYDWPGNVRELENVIHRAFLLSETETVSIPFPLSQGHGEIAVTGRSVPERGFADAKARVIAEFERAYLERLMDRADGNVSRAARLACKERRAFGKLLKKHGIDGESFRYPRPGPR